MKKRFILTLLIISVSFLKSQNCFTSHVTYSSSPWPTSVHSADFNSDGFKDIVVGTVTNSNLQIYFGSPTGTFTSGSSIPVGAASWDLISGDFNGDGKRDLAAACSGTGSVVILLGTGLGTFTSVVGYYMTIPQIVSLATADFNNDGFLDIVGEDFNSGVFYRILGAGNGSFGSATLHSTGGTNPYALCTGDFNSDGNEDVAIANGVTNNVGISFGTGTGSFVLNATYTVGPFPQDIITADFNNDGELDLASANINGGSVSILLGSASGTFAPSVSYPAGSTGIESLEKADFNYDGNLDIVGANFNNSYVEVYLNNGSGVFSTPKFFGVGTNPNGVFAADFNNDLKADIVTSNKNSNNISVLLNYDYTISASPNFSSICIGNTTTLTALGASTYTWNTGSNLSAIAVSPTTTSNYTVVGQNTSGCTHSVVQTITVNALPSLTISAPASSLCQGNTATLSASGASTYTWNPGTLNGASINPIPLSSTVYSVSGTNTSGCVSNTNTFAITVLNLPTVTVNSGSICSGQSFTMIPGGASTYTVSGGTTIVSPVINTSYSITGTSAAGCVSTNTAIAALTVFTTPTLAVNSGSICNGQTFTLLASGANTYTWNGVPNNFSITASPTILSTYSVVGSSTAGCISTNTAVATLSVFATPTLASNSGSICSSNSFTIIPSGANSYTITGGTFTVSPVSTSNYSITGTSTAGCVSNNTAVSTVSVFATPTMAVNSGSICSGQTIVLIGTGANSYTWNGVPTNFSISVSPAIATSYSVVGSSTAGCISLNTAVATVSVFAIPTVASNSGSICSTKSFTILPSGANSYTITGGTFTVSPVSNSNYSITGTSTAGCVSNNTAVSTVSVYATPTMAVNSGSICSGQSFTLTGTGANTYTWNTVPNNFSISVSPSITSTYSVIGTSTAGCISTNTAVATLSVFASPTLAVNSGSICSNNSFTIIPSGANTYTVSGGSFIVAPVTSTNYSVTGTSTAGCISSNTAVSAVNVFATPTLAVNSGSICNGQSFTLVPSGANTYTYSGGSSIISPAITTNYSVTGSSTAGCVSGNTAVATLIVYAIPTVAVNSGSICSNDSFTVVPTGANTYTITGNNFTVSPITTTNYSVTGTSTAGCISTNTAITTVTVEATPTIAVTSGSICSGQTLVLTASGANTYSWNTISNSFTLSVNPNTTTSYTVTGTSTAGCISASAAVSSVTVEATPTISVNSGSICSGDSFTLIPTGALSYTFSSGSNTVNPLTTTSYSVIGTSTAACLSANAAIAAVTVIALPTISITATNTFVCQGLSATLTASGANTYSWSAGSGNAVLSVTPSTTTNYSLLATALSGCTNSAVQSVSVNALTSLLGSVTSTAGNVTGIVILYQKISANGQWDSITHMTINASAYNFTAIPSGSYAVLAVPTQTNLIETYGGSAISWQSASLVSHSCITNYSQNIVVVPILNIGTGPGSMSGQITEGSGFGNKTSEISAGTPIGGISVKGGKNPGGNVVGRTKTNANGDYVLDSLPANGPGESYFILVDIPGLDTNNTYHRIILVGTENYTNLDFVVDSTKINPVDLTVGVKELELENGKLVVYPNPSSGNLNINFTLRKNTEISIDITDLSGRVIKTILSSVKQDKGEVSVRAQLSDIKPGVYFVSIQVGDEVRVTKLIISE
jgi:hypothetical protein